MTGSSTADPAPTTKVRVRLTWRDEEILTAEFLDDPVWIGRSSGCDLVVDDETFSRYHALLDRREGGNYVLRDLRSLNGLYKDERRVASWNLNDGDVLHVGEFALAFDLLDVGEEDGAKLADSVSLSPAAKEKEIKEATATILGRLQPTGTQEGEPLAIIDRDVFTIGASVLADMRVTGPRFPDWCAAIVRGPSGFSLHNVSPKDNTVLLNGAVLRDQGWLKNGCIVELHGRPFVFRTDTAPETGPPEPTPPTRSLLKVEPASDWRRDQGRVDEKRPTSKPKPEPSKAKKPLARVSRRYARPSLRKKDEPRESRAPPWLKGIFFVVWIVVLGAFFVWAISSLTQAF